MRAAPSDAEEVIEAVRTSRSYAGTLRVLGRALVGTNYQYLRERIKSLNLDTSHWKRGEALREVRFTKASPNSRAHVKRVILRDRLIPYICAECTLGPEWNGKPLVLRLDHKNGERDDNRLENLRFLCPNCDSQSPTFCGRNNLGERPTKQKNPCVDCKSTLTWYERCRSCSAKRRFAAHPQATKIAWPTPEQLDGMLSRSSYEAVGRKLGVSGTAVKKRWISYKTSEK